MTPLGSWLRQCLLRHRSSAATVPCSAQAKAAYQKIAQQVGHEHAEAHLQSGNTTLGGAQHTAAVNVCRTA
jgi:hypothetical protein